MSAALAVGAAGAGLVSVSTSGPWLSGSFEIDRAQARVTRLRKAVGVGSKCLLNFGTQVASNNVMVTLTYDLRRTGSDYWHPRHISDYIRCVRRWLRSKRPSAKLRYVWVAELQERGVLHYHAVFFLPHGVWMPRADKRGWWPHGMTNTLKATAPVAYLMKYASKSDSKGIKGFPRGCRIYGVGGLDCDGAALKRWVLAPGYYQRNASVSCPFKRRIGGGFLNVQTGELLQSEFALSGGGFRTFVRIRPRVARIEADGPFSWFPITAATGSAVSIH